MTDYPPSAARSVRRPVMLQGWKDLTFVHFPYDPEVVQRRLPPGLVVDTFEGRAWVGLVAFHMEGIRLPYLPPVPYLGTFPETNVRTYVRDSGGRPGVWFDSLDITRLVPVLVALGTYRLPYRWAEMSIEHPDDAVIYRAKRRWPGPRGATSTIAARPGAPIIPTRSGAFPHRPLGPLQRLWTGNRIRSRRARPLATAGRNFDRPRRPAHRGGRIPSTCGRPSRSLLAGS